MLSPIWWRRLLPGLACWTSLTTALLLWYAHCLLQTIVCYNIKIVLLKQRYAPPPSAIVKILTGAAFGAAVSFNVL